MKDKTDTSDPETITLSMILNHFKENDRHYFEQALSIVRKCIKSPRGIRREINAELFLEICMLPEQERLVMTKGIKNRELLDLYFLNSKASAGLKFLEQYSSLKEGFKKFYGGDTPCYFEAESYLNTKRIELKKIVINVEKKRSAYIGKHAGGVNVRKQIITCLSEVPFGANVLPYQIMFDLCQSFLNRGTLGQPVTAQALHINRIQPIIIQDDHPTFQGEHALLHV